MLVTVEIYGIDFEATFNYSKGEPMVLRTPNGDGHPGSPPEIFDIELRHEGTDFTDFFDQLDKMEYVEKKIWQKLSW